MAGLGNGIARQNWAVIIGAARLSLRLDGAYSLKDKRQTLRSLLDRSRRYGVAVAEVEDHDLWNVAGVGIACVSNQTEHARSLLQHAINLFEESPLVIVESAEIQVTNFPDFQ